MSADVAATLDRLLADLRARLDPLGCVDYDNGGFETGQISSVRHLVTVFQSFGDRTVHIVERELAYRTRAGLEVWPTVHPDYAALLRRMNGAWFFGVSLHGSLHPDLNLRPGQPIGIVYQNIYERPAWIPKDHLGFGAINGRRRAQGHLYLAATGEVHLYHRDADLIGKTWPSLAAFLDDEIRRRLTLYNDDWTVRSDAKLLPGDTDDWEEIAKAAAQAQGRP